MGTKMCRISVRTTLVFTPKVDILDVWVLFLKEVFPKIGKLATWGPRAPLGLPGLPRGSPGPPRGPRGSLGPLGPWPSLVLLIPIGPFCTFCTMEPLSLSPQKEGGLGFQSSAGSFTPFPIPSDHP